MPTWGRILAAVVVAAAIAAAGIGANLYLLGVGGADADPVGRLTPRAGLTPVPATGASTGTTTGVTTDDDDGGGSRGRDHDGDDD